MIARIFERTRPDVISLCPFGWMSLGETRACMDLSLWDPDFVAAMEASDRFLEARGFGPGSGHPLPHDARAHMLKFLVDEIRRHDRTIPVSLCLETVEMWALFKNELGMPMDPDKTPAYYWNCGPTCTPGGVYSKRSTTPLLLASSVKENRSYKSVTPNLPIRAIYGSR